MESFLAYPTIKESRTTENTIVMHTCSKSWFTNHLLTKAALSLRIVYLTTNNKTVLTSSLALHSYSCCLPDFLDNTPSKEATSLHFKMIEIDCLRKTPDFFFVVEFIRDHLSLRSYVSVSPNPNLRLFPDISSLFGISCLYFCLSFKRLFICKCEFMWISVCPPLLPSAYSFYNRVSLDMWGPYILG